MKLSPAQLSILQGLANGSVLYQGYYTSGGLMPPRFRGEARQEYKAVSLRGLLKRGLVRHLPYKNGSFESCYAITAEGQKALAEHVA